MQPLIGSPSPSLPPKPSLLSQAAPTLLGVVGGISGAILGSVLPGTGTAVGSLVSLGQTVGGGVGVLFEPSAASRVDQDWMKELADHERGRAADAPGVAREQAAVAGLGPLPSRPGALGVPVPGLQAEAVRRFLR